MGFAFIDDADLIQGADDVNTYREELISNFQRFYAMVEWQDQSFWRCNFPKKIKWFLINFKWNSSNYEYCTIEGMPSNISIPGKDRFMITIKI